MDLETNLQPGGITLYTPRIPLMVDVVRALPLAFVNHLFASLIKQRKCHFFIYPLAKCRISQQTYIIINKM